MVVLARAVERAAVAHIDDNIIASPTLIETLACGSQEADIYISGSYGRASATSLASVLLQQLEQAPQVFNLRLFCCGKENTLSCGSPRCQNLFVNTSTGQAFANVSLHVRLLLPAFDERMAAGFVDGAQDLRNIYNFTEGSICLQPLEASGMSWQVLMYLESWLEMDDDELLAVSSTSPQHERPTYAEGEPLAQGWLCCGVSQEVHLSSSIAHVGHNDALAA